MDQQFIKAINVSNYQEVVITYLFIWWRNIISLLAGEIMFLKPQGCLMFTVYCYFIISFNYSTALPPTHFSHLRFYGAINYWIIHNLPFLFISRLMVYIRGGILNLILKEGILLISRLVLVSIKYNFLFIMNNFLSFAYCFHVLHFL